MTLHKLILYFSSIFHFSFLGVTLGQAIPQSINKLPDTGQNRDYTTTFGEDSDYLINTPNYRLNADGTTDDLVTGLQWQSQDAGEMTFESAIQYCDSLRLAGHENWRLPTLLELFSIFNHQTNNPALNNVAFIKTDAEYWWSSQEQHNDPGKIWVCNAGGGAGNHRKTETLSSGGTKRFHVRAVRDLHSPGILLQRFINVTSNIVLDSLTGLQWTVNSPTDSMDWEQALQYAESLELDGKKDWRLPNVKELQSIHSIETSNPALPFPFILPRKNINLWSSTTLANQSSSAWYMYTLFGILTYLPKNTKNYILCVRGNSNPTKSVDVFPSKSQGIQFFVKNQTLCIESLESIGAWKIIDVYGKTYQSGHSFGKQIEIPFVNILPGKYIFLTTYGASSFIWN